MRTKRRRRPRSQNFAASGPIRGCGPGTCSPPPPLPPPGPGLGGCTAESTGHGLSLRRFLPPWRGRSDACAWAGVDAATEQVRHLSYWHGGECVSKWTKNNDTALGCVLREVWLMVETGSVFFLSPVCMFLVIREPQVIYLYSGSDAISSATVFC
ncbi:uncharacterized protein KNAG_0A07050 [Huiozyma naganishii CBS 8797]|uniref:Uncharacterized protein n=1 Tax=Huiozyma naganishii (strain ATCC MYA-139 / BCRC 22969 / CBS 8797 / KCTC 17520 / NBRC 10181 / NCYC 3082 / Yp74L-3) TaxID=1071383 RepID=J7S2U8_HUIN7|nr:hypothetical protein KNAG_0A07050 [Kazachstania naganishii CBS 8797]CCK68359.1 hypothetical protein KNAG_0A07050 [Kazachstania naganishii CBS 8797]